MKTNSEGDMHIGFINLSASIKTINNLNLEKLKNGNRWCRTHVHTGFMNLSTPERYEGIPKKYSLPPDYVEMLIYDDMSAGAA